MRVLYIHPFKSYGGATKSLIEILKKFPAHKIQSVVITPKGEASKAFRQVGAKVFNVNGISQWDNTKATHYKGFRWLILLRELFYLPGSILALIRVKSYGPFSLIHCNEITTLFIGVLARKIIAAPLLIHIRSLQRGKNGGKVSSWIMSILNKNADMIIAIDEAVRRTLPKYLPIRIIYNGLGIKKKTNTKVAKYPIFIIAIVGSLHRQKGLFELLEAANIMRNLGLKFKILVIGKNTHSFSGITGWLMSKLDFARDVKAELEEYILKNQLESFVEFKGFISDIRNIYPSIDLLCFPSLIDAPGRPVFEAALHAVPSIVAMKKPTKDVIIHGVTGLCIDNPSPEKIAKAITLLYNNRALCRKMGSKAQLFALNRFDSEITAAQMLNAYRILVENNNIR
jgi:glycosyltransferase involved in cell wall biosynthesis